MGRSNGDVKPGDVEFWQGPNGGEEETPEEGWARVTGGFVPMPEKEESSG